MKKTIAVIALIAAPALASAQAGLSKIQFLALQQELRDQGCGVTNVDGLLHLRCLRSGMVSTIYYTV